MQTLPEEGFPVKKQISVHIIPPKKIPGVGRKNLLIGRSPSTRNKDIKAPLSFGRNLFPGKTATRDQTVESSSREAIPTHRSPGVRAGTLKL